MKKLLDELTTIRVNKIDELIKLDVDSIDFAVLLDEIVDALYAIQHIEDVEKLERTMYATTSGSIYDAIKNHLKDTEVTTS